MRSSLKALVAALALAFAPAFATADEVAGDDMQELLNRMADLEQQLRATNDALAAANARVDQLQRGPGAAAPPETPLSRFLKETEFSGS